MIVSCKLYLQYVSSGTLALSQMLYYVSCILSLNHKGSTPQVQKTSQVWPVGWAGNLIRLRMLRDQTADAQASRLRPLFSFPFK